MKPLNVITVNKPIRPEKVVQFGEGNFLRGFADWIIQAMNNRTAFNGSVVIIQPRPGGHVADLNAQDDLYHVNLQGTMGGSVINTVELIDCVSRGIDPYADFESFRRLAEQPALRFVISNTTEAGIAFDDACRLEDKPALSFPGKLVQFLYYRYLFFHGDPSKGMVIFPCELVFDNGKRLREVMLQYIDLWALDHAFKQWFMETCPVYSTLVDRIVPGFPRHEIEELKERLQFDDNQIVQAEAFHLWVIEAPKEIAKEFPAAEAGMNVVFVPSERPYHERKVTLLNGPHTVLSPVAYLCGLNIVREACIHPIVGRYIHKVMHEELMETLDLPRQELENFAADVMDRFLNPFVDHQLTSIMLNSFSKYKTRDLPGLEVFLQRKGHLPVGLVFGLAAIITYYKGGTRQDGVQIQPNDAAEVVDLLKELWSSGDIAHVADGVLGASFIWDEDLRLVPGLGALLKTHLQLIEDGGMMNAVKTIV